MGQDYAVSVGVWLRHLRPRRLAARGGGLRVPSQRGRLPARPARAVDKSARLRGCAYSPKLLISLVTYT
jgi:hypothetical protein